MRAFFVALYKGDSKPPSAEVFLRQFLDEIHELSGYGLDVSINGVDKLFEIKVDKFILDSPARSFLKCIIAHNGYFSCERCEEEGVSLRKVDRNVKSTKNQKPKTNKKILVTFV